ncbi:hypothetical protein LSAT2_021652 [Lamellibrachia satsuma]|nr:hypothetical protein LSAT2_021652 [Lamellibrachia satsuma]
MPADVVALFSDLLVVLQTVGTAMFELLDRAMHRAYWPCVMIEMQHRTIERRVTVTGQFRDDLYIDGLLPAFMHHASLWRHVLSELHHLKFGYRHHDISPESWDDNDDACHTSATDFLDHRRRWSAVMADLQHYPRTPSGRSPLPRRRRSPLLRRRRRTLAPLPLDKLGRRKTHPLARRKLLVLFNNVG